MTAGLVARLAGAGCVAPEDEAAELIEAAAGDPDRLEAMTRRRESGEPLAWVTGSIRFGPLRLQVDPGVYVPRQQTLVLVEAAAQVLPDNGLAVDLCTGSGAVARSLQHARPAARVIGTDTDPAACRCAAANRIECYVGDLDGPLLPDLAGTVDVVTAVAPYVPTDAVAYLPRDSRDFEPESAYHGGPGGLDVVVRVVAAAARLLHPGGTLAVELGGQQDRALLPRLEAAGFDPGKVETFTDEDGDLRALRAVLL